MPNPIVECIPNFSEARRPEVIDAIIQAIAEVPGVNVLDRHSDLDHNRTVVTMVGEPKAVEEAAFQAIRKAQQLINLDEHEGAHPRIGATDVVPFVPISDMTMLECVELARHLGRRVAEELHIPVYLYEEAAGTPDRQNLENIRKGQYEGLKDEIATNPDRKPDFGPSALGTAGATVIGARAPLIAFNVYLTTSEVGIAQKIARVVRNSTGGLRFVKAMGVLVEGRAQVSMNLTNFRQTPIARVVEMVRREAQRYGVGIHHSELVGLIPQAALVDTAVWYTQMDDFEPQQILESRLFQAASQGAVISGGNKFGFIDELASENPTPGGGSAAAYTGAEAAALVAMVGRVTVGKKKYADVESQMWEMINQADSLRAQLISAVDEDAKAFEGYLQAIRLPKNTEEEISVRAVAMKNTTLEAIRIPKRVAELAEKVLELSLTAATIGNVNAISDAGSAASLAIAAIKSAAMNVKINIKSLEEITVASKDLRDVELMLEKASGLEQKIKAVIFNRAQI